MLVEACVKNALTEDTRYHDNLKWSILGFSGSDYDDVIGTIETDTFFSK